jgi:hypothetical protein
MRVDRRELRPTNSAGNGSVSENHNLCCKLLVCDRFEFHWS